MVRLVTLAVSLLFSTVYARTATNHYIVINAGHLLDVKRGKITTAQTILVRGGTIEAVGSHNELKIPEQSTVIDLSKAWVLPGLIDCHTHIITDVDPGWENAPVKETTADSALRGARNALITLRAGFTTIRDVGASGFTDVSLMRAIDQNWIPGPRIYPSGHIIGITGGNADITGFAPGIRETGPKEGIADGVDEILKAVRYQLKQGAKLIKFCATAGVMSFEDSASAQQYSDEEIQALIQEAHRHGVKVAAHAHGAEGLKAAVRAGADSIEHGSLIDEEGIALMKARGTYLVPTIFTWYYDTNLVDWPEKIRAKSFLIDAQRKERQKAAISAGVKVAFGTDAGTYPHGLNAGEFKYLVEYGLTPMQAIQSATINAAELLGQSDKLGSLDPAKFADIIAVNEDPLRSIATLEKISFVMKNGVVYKSDGVAK